MSDEASNGGLHLIWDWNGTLMDDVWLCVEVLNTLLAARGLPEVDVNSYRRDFGFPVVDFYRSLGFDLSPGSFEKVSVEFIEAYNRRREECRLHRGVDETLQRLRAAGFTHYILSAYRQDSLEEIVGYYGLQGHFSALFGLDDIYARGKIELGRRKMRELRLVPEAVVLIGDTVHDGEVAEALGVACHLLDHGHHTRERLEACGVPVHSSLDACFRALG